MIEIYKADMSLLVFCLDLTMCMFLLGVIGCVLNRRNILISLLCLELTFLSSAINFMIIGLFIHSVLGYIYALLIIIVIVVDTVFGLSLVILSYKCIHITPLHALVTLRG